MRWAICPTLSIKVDADDIIQVSRCRGDFICPVCHVSITYRHESYDGKSACFVHPEANKGYATCPLRTIGFNITPNEGTIRAPFPLILTRDGSNYHLNVKFRAIPEKYRNLSSIWLYIDAIQLRFQLSEIFNGNVIKLISRPPSSNTRILRVDASRDNLMLLNSWGSYIDYFKVDGALFEYNTGKKVAINDSVYCGTDYLFISTSEIRPAFRNFFNSILVEKKGGLNVSGRMYPVYHIRSPEYRNDEAIRFFGQFDNPLKEKIAEPMLLWPPAIRDKDVLNTIWSNGTLYFLMNKSKERKIWMAGPDVRSLSSLEYKELNTDGSIIYFCPYSDEFTLEISQSDGSASISVSRDNAEMYISNDLGEMVEFVDNENRVIDDLTSAVSISTNFPYHMMVIHKDYSIHSDKGTKSFPMSDRIIKMVIYNHHLAQIRSLSISSSPKISEEAIKLSSITERMLESVPNWFNAALHNLSKHDPVMARKLALQCLDGKISSKSLRCLQEWRLQ